MGSRLAGSVSNAASISADGRYVEFESQSSNLVPGGPADGFYVKDMQTGAVELASRGTGPAGAAAATVDSAVISGDGRHVAFTAPGALHADNADGAQARRMPMCARWTRARRTWSASAPRARRSEVSTTGRLPTSTSAATPSRSSPARSSSADDTDGTDDAYVRLDIGAQAEQTRFVSFTTNQAQGADTAAEVALSGDGSTAAWSTGSTGGSDLGRSIFMASLRPDVGTARELDVSRPGGSGSGGGNPAFEPVPSATRFPVLLYFRSDAGLDSADTNGTADLYAAEIAHPGDGNFVHLETSGKANGSVDAGAGADGGAVVAFDSAASSLPGADGVRGEVYLRSARC